MRTAIGLGVILVIIVFVVAVLWRRRGRDEIHSIDSYRSALDTLQEMRGPDGSASIRVLGADEQHDLRQPPAVPSIYSGVHEPPPKTEAIAPPAAAHDGMVFNDGGSEVGRSNVVSDTEPGSGHEDPSWAISRMESRPRFQSRQIIVGLIAGLVIILLVVVGALIGSSHTSSKAKVTSTTHHRSHTSHKGTTPTTTTTAVPTSYEPQDATATSATYTVASSNFVVTVTAKGGPCWTVVTAVNGGAQLFAGTVMPGSPNVIKATGPIEISLGAPANAAASVGGVPVSFPSGFQSPLVLTFQPMTTPSGPGATSTTTSTPPGTTTSGITP